MSAGSQGCPRERRAIIASISVARGTATSSGESHSGCTTTVAGSITRRMSLRKGEDLPVIRGGMGKGQGNELISPEHADVRLWVL